MLVLGETAGWVISGRMSSPVLIPSSAASELRPQLKTTLKPKDKWSISRSMQINDLVFSGFNRRVFALHRLTGQIIWQWKAPKGSSYVTLLLDREVLIVSVDGYMYGLDPLTGNERWYNPMEGCGVGVTSLVSIHGTASNTVHIAAADAAARAAASSSNDSNNTTI
jgi:outer membrane protein assembly factor BamB